MADIRMDMMEIKDRRGKTLGTVRTNFIHDAKERKVGYVQGNNIFDNHGGKLGTIEGNMLFDPDGNKLAGLDEIKRKVPGSPGGTMMAAVWLLFGR